MRIKKEEERKVAVVEPDKKLAWAVDEVLRSDAGRYLWAHLARECGFFETSLTRRTDGELAALSIEAKEAQRFLYLKLREKASPELRRAAEALAENPEFLKPTAQPKEEERKK